MSFPSISVAIPTYNREDTLLNTLNQLLALNHRACEILVIDQTTSRQAETAVALEKLAVSGGIVWHKLNEPSIPKAMNYALMVARAEVVLFLDDDIELTSDLVVEHAKEYEDPEVVCVAGRVVQPWEHKLDACESAWLDVRSGDPDAFRFNSRMRADVKRFMGGNFSIKRQMALDLGGFDENFIKVAYRFEAEFADRMLRAGLRILFQPTASLNHLKANTGGTRSFGDHLRSIWPAHSVGRYYYLLMVNQAHHRFRRMVLGPLYAVHTRHHLTRPWLIPVTLLSELSGVVLALWLFVRGPRHIDLQKSQ
ncbi:MAG: glycosyltransferase [Verrucomicrobia bacterium]|nr:glycosyltransferase [Verrucomicrobiota bacterium]